MPIAEVMTGPDTSVEIEADTEDALDLAIERYHAERMRVRGIALKRARDHARARIEKLGGSDVDPHPLRFPDPGVDDLRTSMASFERDWRAVDESELYGLVPTGEPPSNADHAYLLQRAKSDYRATGMPEHESTPYEKFATNTWLEGEMHKLRVKDAITMAVAFKRGRKVVFDDAELLWREAVIMRNGYVKMLCELRQHADRYSADELKGGAEAAVSSERENSSDETN